MSTSVDTFAGPQVLVMDNRKGYWRRVPLPLPLAPNAPKLEFLANWLHRRMGPKTLRGICFGRLCKSISFRKMRICI